MLKLIEEIRGVQPLSLRKIAGNIYYNIENVTYLNGKSYDRYLSILDFSTFQDRLYLYQDSKLYEFVDNDFIEKIAIPGVNKIKVVNDKILLGWRKISRKENEFTFYDYKGNLLWSNSGDISISANNGIIFSGKTFDETYFTILEGFSGKHLWQFTLPEGYKMYGDIQIHDNILTVPLENNQNKITIVGLDIISGKTLWQTKTSLAYYKKKDNKLYGFASTSFGDNFYSEINIETGEIFEKKFEGYNKNVVSHLATIHNDYLFYSVYKNNCEIGVIDLKSKNIIHEYPLNLGQGIQIGAPVITDDKIYILDSNNTLHIYEKEESIL